MPKARAKHFNKLWITRKKAGLGQKSVARLLGHRCTSPISDYENGKLLPNLRAALKLSIIYNTPLSDLYAPLFGELTQEVETTRRSLPGGSRDSSLPNVYEKDPLANAYSCR